MDVIVRIYLPILVKKGPYYIANWNRSFQRELLIHVQEGEIRSNMAESRDWEAMTVEEGIWELNVPPVLG